MMERRRIGRTELEVSPLTLGCWAFAGGSNWGEQSEGQSIEVIRAALDRGINFLDTAPGYGDGESERIVGKALQGRREQAVVATKVPQDSLAAEQVRKSCERSLSLLQTDYVDLLQVHWASWEVPFEETIGAMEALKEEGKVRHYGVCNFGVRDMENWLGAGGEMVSNQLPYSLLSRAIEFEIAPQCVEKSVSILPYSPLLQGLLTGKFKRAEEVPDGRARTRHFSGQRAQARHGEPGCEAETFAAIKAVGEVARQRGVSMAELSLAWLLRQPGVRSVIVGARSAQQLEENLRSVEVEVDDVTEAALRQATEPVKAALGANPDLWGGESRYR